jgi:Flp pilus assembly protein TadD
MERNDEAIEELRAAIDVYPGHWLAHAELGEELARRADWPGAERHLLEAVRRQPDLAPAWVVLADVYRRSGRAEQARAAHERAMQLRGDRSEEGGGAGGG